MPTRRKVIGARSSETGLAVPKSRLETDKLGTVAVTKIVGEKVVRATLENIESGVARLGSKNGLWDIPASDLPKGVEYGDRVRIKLSKG